MKRSIFISAALGVISSRWRWAVVGARARPKKPSRQQEKTSWKPRKRLPRPRATPSRTPR